MSNQEIPKQVLDALNKDTEIKIKNAPHIQRVSRWGIYLNFFNSLFPILLRYSKLTVIVYATIHAIQGNGIVKTLLKFIIEQKNWYMLLIGCATFVITYFIHKKYH